MGMWKEFFAEPRRRVIAAILAVTAVGVLGYLLSPVLVPLLFAFLVAYIFNPMVDLLQARKAPRSVTVAALAFIAVLLLLAFVFVLIPLIVDEANQLIAAPKQPGEPAGPVGAWVNHVLDRLPLQRFVVWMGWAPDGQGIDARAILAEKIGGFVKNHAIQMLKASAPTLAGMGQRAGVGLAQILASLGRGIVNSLLFLGNFALFVLVAGYLLRDFDKVIRSARGLVPPRYRERIFELVGRIDAQLRSFLRGQVTVCLCLGVMYAVGLTLARVPFAIPLALFGGAVSIVPYLGLALTIGPALLLAFLQNGLDWHLIAVVATFAIAQMIEGMLLTPTIVGDRVGLNPVWVILAIMVFGTAFGFVGLLVAVPIAACLKVVVEEAMRVYRRSGLFEPAGSGPPSGPDSA